MDIAKEWSKLMSIYLSEYLDYDFDEVMSPFLILDYIKHSPSTSHPT